MASGLLVPFKVVRALAGGGGRDSVVGHLTERLLYGRDSCHLGTAYHPRRGCLLPFHYRLLWYLKNWVPKCRTFVSWVNSAVRFERWHSSLLRCSHSNLMSHPDVIILPLHTLSLGWAWTLCPDRPQLLSPRWCCLPTPPQCHCLPRAHERQC